MRRQIVADDEAGARTADGTFDAEGVAVLTQSLLDMDMREEQPADAPFLPVRLSRHIRLPFLSTSSPGLSRLSTNFS